LTDFGVALGAILNRHFGVHLFSSVYLALTKGGLHMTTTSFELRSDFNNTPGQNRLFRRSFLATASCLALMLAMPYPAVAETAPTPAAQMAAASPPAAVSKTNAAQQEQTQTAEKRKQISAEAIAAIRETQNALKALDEGKKSDALAALERATGKLELILARDPKLALAPTDVSAMTMNIMADAQKVKEVRNEAERLLSKGQVQDARHLLHGLASETVIGVSNIPLATYPAAIKQAVRLVDSGKDDEAKAVLQTALNTLVITNTIIPLPVVEAQAMLLEAEKLAEKADRTADDNKRLDHLLTQGRARLEFAQALGYGTEKDFSTLYAQLDTIKEKTGGNKSGAGFFDAIKSSLSELVKSVQSTAASLSSAGNNPNSKNGG
jgi:hypothetical protein